MDEKTFADCAELVKKYKAGDESAFAALYEKTARPIYMICKSILGNPEDASDAMQETYMTVVSNIGSLEDEMKFIGWANRIAAYKSYDILRKRKGNIPYEDAIASEEDIEGNDDLESLPDYFITEESKREIFRDIIRKELSEVQYQTILLHYFNEMSVEEIASVMNCPEGTVKTRLKSSRVKIRSAVENYEKENKDKLGAYIGLPFMTRFFRAEASTLRIPDISSVFNINGNSKLRFPDVSNTSTSSPVSGSSGTGPSVSFSSPASKAKAGLVASISGKAIIIVAAAAFVFITGIVLFFVLTKNNDKSLRYESSSEYNTKLGRKSSGKETGKTLETASQVTDNTTIPASSAPSDSEPSETPSASASVPQSSVETTDPNETATVIPDDPYQAPDTGWVEAYAKIASEASLNDFEDNNLRNGVYPGADENLYFDLIYINEDAVPELLVSVHPNNVEYHSRIYTYVDGTAVFLYEMTDWQEPAIYVPRCNRIHHHLHQELYRDAIANMSGDSTTMEYTIPDSSQFFSSTYEFDYDKYRKVFACDEYDFEDLVAKYTASEFTSHLGRSV